MPPIAAFARFERCDPLLFVGDIMARNCERGAGAMRGVDLRGDLSLRRPLLMSVNR
jgi:hypothetical protein